MHFHFIGDISMALESLCAFWACQRTQFAIEKWCESNFHRFVSTSVCAPTYICKCAGNASLNKQQHAVRRGLECCTAAFQCDSTQNLSKKMNIQNVNTFFGTLRRPSIEPIPRNPFDVLSVVPLLHGSTMGTGPFCRTGGFINHSPLTLRKSYG